MHPDPAPVGYYKIRLKDGTCLFARVVSEASAAAVKAGIDIQERLAHKGLPAVHLVGSPSALPGRHVLFVFRWIDGRFAVPTDEQIRTLGVTVADLHCILLSNDIVESREAVQTSEEPPASITRLALESGSQHEETRAARSMVESWSDLQETLSRKAQWIHNDLHPGNVLFDSNDRVAALLDFEEVPHSFYSPAVDLSWIVERFCFIPLGAPEAARLATLFLLSYLRRSGCRLSLDVGWLEQLIRWRCVTAMSILERRRFPHLSRSQERWKFRFILSELDSWRPFLGEVERSISI